MMLAAIEADLATIFDDAVFAESASWTPTGKAIRKVKGIFDDGHVTINDDGYADRTVREVKFVAASADLDGIVEGEPLIIRTVTYYAAVVMLDGTGTTTVHLAREAP